MLENSVGCIWSDEWIPGYHIHKVDYWFDVKAFDEETVSTPAGTFKNCRHVYYHLRGNGGVGATGDVKNIFGLLRV